MNDRRERARSLSRRMEALILALTGVVILFVAYGLWMTWEDPDRVGQFIIDKLALPDSAQFSIPTIRLLAAAFLVQAAMVIWALQALRRAFHEISLHDIVSMKSARLVRLSGLAFLVNAIAMVLAPPLVSLIVSLDMPVGHRFVAISFSSAELLAVIVSGTLIVFGHLLAVAAEVDDENKRFV